MGVKKWQGETEIKAQLRELTEKTRTLRRDLDEVMRTPERGYLHRPGPVGQANQRERKKKR